MQQAMHHGFTAGISPHKPEEMNQTKEMHITNWLISEDWIRISKWTSWSIYCLRFHWQVRQLLQLANTNNSVTQVCRQDIVTTAQNVKILLINLCPEGFRTVWLASVTFRKMWVVECSLREETAGYTQAMPFLYLEAPTCPHISTFVKAFMCCGKLAFIFSFLTLI